MPFVDAVGLFNYWSEYPPLHILVRNFLGYEPPKKVEADPVEVAHMMQALSGRSGRAKSLDMAPEYIQKMAYEMKEKAKNAGR